MSKYIRHGPSISKFHIFNYTFHCANKIVFIEKFQNGSDAAIGIKDQPSTYDALVLEENSKDPVNDKISEMKRVFKEKEDKLTSELQDAKDQAELLEFRVLELEEEQEKVKLCNWIIKTK